MADTDTYQDFAYGVDDHGRWYYVLPSSQRAYPHDNTEAGVKAAIDWLLRNFKNS